VRTVWTVDGRYHLTGSGYHPEGELFLDAGRPGNDPDEGTAEPFDLEADRAVRWSLVAGAACNDARLVHDDETWSVIGDPTEAAMLVAAAKAGIDRKELTRSFERLRTIPFSSERRYMATLHREGDGSLVVVVKGAVERVLELCGSAMTADGGRADLDGDTVSLVAEELAADGLRVLATAQAAVGDGEAFDVDRLRGAMTFVGLQAMLDPPRQAAIDAVATCHQAGIAVKMITGDHATTATAIAEQLGILGERVDGDVLTGAQLGQLSPEEYPGAVERASVFARVSPEQKLRLVEGLQTGGQVVAMTGDGVNDAPALQQADIGVAMGRGGTEVAKEASDMVLTDDDFATIEAAIEEGRGVFDNLKKYIVWTVPTNMGEGLVILSAIVVGAALPILPVQILWINMTTALALGLMLAFEPKEGGIMQRPPRDPSEPLFDRALVTRILLVAGLLVGGAWWIFEWELASGAELPEARTAAINLFIAVKIAYLLSCRSLTQSVRQIGFFSNRWILWGIAAQLLGQLAITYLPVMNTVFGTAPISLRTWLLIFLAGAVAQVVVITHKRLGRDRAERRRQVATVDA
jgi:cation-transporting P-type ATPase F